MQESDFKEFALLMGIVADMVGQNKLPKMALRLYFNILQPYSLKEVKMAIDYHLRTSSYMPKPADIVGYLEGTARDRAAEAWAHVIKAIKKYGSYTSVKFDDPAIHYAIDRMGGWLKVCSMTYDEEPFRAKDFQEHYMRAQGISWEAVPRRLAGRHEINNRARGALEAPEGCQAYTGAEVVEIKTRMQSLRNKNLYISAGGELDEK